MTHFYSLESSLWPKHCFPYPPHPLKKNKRQYLVFWLESMLDYHTAYMAWAEGSSSSLRFTQHFDMTFNSRIHSLSGWSDGLYDSSVPEDSSYGHEVWPLPPMQTLVFIRSNLSNLPHCQSWNHASLPMNLSTQQDKIFSVAKQPCLKTWYSWNKANKGRFECILTQEFHFFTSAPNYGQISGTFHCILFHFSIPTETTLTLAELKDEKVT